MNSISQYIESGVLELYVLGALSPEEGREVKCMAALHPEVRLELDKIAVAVETYAQEHKVEPHPAVKPFILAIIDYTERLQNGEQVSFPPILNKNSSINDYSAWLNREDMVLPADFEEMHAKIIGYTPEATTAIVWLKSMAPHEVHADEFERFLILEGTCDITIGDEVNHLIPGDYLQIPLHKGHHVTVTSSLPCKIILQRIAA